METLNNYNGSKTNKPKHQISSYRPISLLLTIGKLFENILLKHFTSIIQEKKCLPKIQYGFSIKHNTIHQINRITDKISTSFEEKKFCPGVFLDIGQVFGRVWHNGLLFKLNSFLPPPYYLIIKSYLEIVVQL
jgi:hypothetical protein